MQGLWLGLEILCILKMFERTTKTCSKTKYVLCAAFVLPVPLQLTHRKLKTQRDALRFGGCGFVGQVVLLCSGALVRWVLLLCPKVSLTLRCAALCSLCRWSCMCHLQCFSGPHCTCRQWTRTGRRAKRRHPS